MCIAVGNNRPQHTLAEKWNGRTWRVLAAASVGQLNFVSCPAVAFCMAVGRGFGGGGQSVAMSWNGTSWQPRSVPAPSGAADSDLLSVSCANATNCIAVGSYRTSSSVGAPSLPLAAQWDGTAWTLLSLAAPDPGSAYLTDVSCASAASCVAVGADSTASGLEALAEEWDGQTWSLLPSAPGAAQLSGVSCTDASKCMVIGLSPIQGEVVHTVAERWNGQSWQVHHRPAEPFVRGGLARVSCVAQDRCMAVGSAEMDIPPFGTGLAEQWNGSSWQLHRVSRVGILSSVSCPSASRCVAVGGYLSAADRQLTLAERWNGRSWLVLKTPGLGRIFDVSCSSMSFCMAVAGDRSLAWNGSRWRLLRLAIDQQLLSVSCTGQAFCMAVGRDGRAMEWNGTKWRTPGVLHPQYLLDASPASAPSPAWRSDSASIAQRWLSCGTATAGGSC